MPALRELPRLWRTVALPLAALCAAAALHHGLAEVRANAWLAQGLDGLAVRFVRDQVHADVAWALLVASGIVAAWLPLLPLRGIAPVLGVYPLAGGLLLLVTRALHPREWATQAERGGLALPSLLSDPALLRAVGLAAVAVALLATLLAWQLRRRGADLASLGRSPRLARASWAAGVFVAAVLLVVNAAPLVRPLSVAERPIPVIYLTWDSTRADHVGCYGYARPTTPHLDAFAADAVLYRRAVSQHNWTRPSYASIFGGLPQWALPGGGFGRSTVALAEVLRQHGYRTLGFVQNPNLDAELDFDQGFERYLHLGEWSGPELVTRRVRREIERLAGSEEPFFLFVHYQGPHWPYPRGDRFAGDFRSADGPPIPPERVRQLMKSNGQGWDPGQPGAEAERRSMVDLYDASIRRTDEALGHVLDALRQSGLYERSLILFNSDHGDEFGDHRGFGHAHGNLHPELTHVPMVVRYPGRGPAVVDTPVQSLDLFPTVLSVVGIEPPVHLLGAPLDRGAPEGRVAYSNRGATVALRHGGHSLVVDYDAEDGGRVRGFYDARVDPGERAGLVGAEDTGPYQALRALADAWAERYRREVGGETEAMSEGLTERLRALGYVE